MSSKGSLICFLGIDGSGKTTAAKELCRRLEEEGFDCQYMDLSYSLLNFIPSVLRRAAGKRLFSLAKAAPTKASLGNGSKPVKKTSWILLWATLTLVLIDSLVKYLVKVRPLRRKSIVVFDRYFYDYVILYGKVCPSPLAWGFYRLIPGPDAVFLLDLPPAVARARNNDDFPLDFYQRQRERYLSYAQESNSRFLTLCTTDDSAGEADSLIYRRVMEVIKGDAPDGEE